MVGQAETLSRTIFCSQMLVNPQNDASGGEGADENPNKKSLGGSSNGDSDSGSSNNDGSGSAGDADSNPNKKSLGKGDLINSLKKKFGDKDVDKAMQLLDKKGGGANGRVDGAAPSDLTFGSIVSSASAEVSEADKTYCKAHWVNAKRNYKAKNYDRAIDEIKNILGVDPGFAEAYLMRASIFAKRKAFTDAWRDLEKARKKLADDPKLKKFEETLAKASPKPENIVESASANRNPPLHVSELTLDVLEDVLSDMEIASKVNLVSVKPFVENDGKVDVTITFSGKSAIDADVFEKKVKEISKQEVKDIKPGKDGKELEMVLNISGLPKENPAVKPVNGLSQFLKDVSEESDVKVESSEEGNVDANKFVEGKYVLLAKGLSEMNAFMRKLSPYASNYHPEKLETRLINNQPILKGSMVVRFKVE